MSVDNLTQKIAGQQGQLEIQTSRGNPIIPVRFTGLVCSGKTGGWIIFAEPLQENSFLPPGSWGYESIDPMLEMAEPSMRGMILVRKIQQQQDLLVRETQQERQCPNCELHSPHTFCTRCGRQLRLQLEPPGGCSLSEHTRQAQQFSHCPRCGASIHELPAPKHRFQKLE